MPVHPHDRLGLALHRAVRERIQAEPALVAEARARLARWLAQGRIDAAVAARWREALDAGGAQLDAVLLGESDDACELRQSSPFAGALPHRERSGIVRAEWTGRTSNT